MLRVPFFVPRPVVAGAGFVFAAASFPAWSQSITYGPLASAIPSLGGASLVLLSAMMFVVLWQLKKRGMIDGSRFMAIALVAGGMASGISGVKLVADARAQGGGAASITLSQAGGGTTPLELGLNCVRNVTSLEQQILAINVPPLLFNPVGNVDCFETPPQGGGLADDCAVGTRLLPTLACFVEVQPFVQGGNNGGQASDLRLKVDIARVGTADNGLPLYEFRYLGGTTRYRGVMAQDVLMHTPEAVLTRPDGYMAVRYDMLGLEMTVAQY